jgi:hypothetical protein
MRLQVPSGFRQPKFKDPVKIVLSRRHFSVNRLGTERTLKITLGV